MERSLGTLNSSTTRRTFLGAAGAAGLAAGAFACAPTASPPSPATGAASQPSAPAKQAWEQDWDRLVDAARQEGKLSIFTVVGAGFRKALDAFQAAFPGIQVEHESLSSLSLFLPKLFQERDSGLFARDVAIVAVASMLGAPRDKGVLEPIPPLVFRPDVLEDKYWQGGFTHGFADAEKKFCYIALEAVNIRFWINTDLIKDDSLKSVRDLLKPEFKGRVLLPDVRTGSTFVPFAAIRANMGDEVVKQLIVDQEPVFVRDNGRLLVEQMVRDKFPVTCGIVTAVLQEFHDQGIGKNLKPIDLPEARNVAGSAALYAITKAPHPNAAKLFINWFLTQEGQKIWSKGVEENSRRTDVPPFEPSWSPIPGAKYFAGNREESLKAIADTQRFLIQLVASR